MASNDDTLLEQQLQRAAAAIESAHALIVTAGAGMGVDSGLPDFRGPEGFWRAYPPLKDKGIRLEDMSNPQWFEKDPEFAWGFFGHRYNLYENATPHAGFQILKKWASRMPKGYFVFTSNVDGHFQRAGFDPDRVVECHGSIHFMQTADPEASHQIWPVPEGTTYDVDVPTLRAKGRLPRGPPGVNSTLARPNILMFNDYLWHPERTNAQRKRYDSFKRGIFEAPFVVVEIGAGSYVPTVRWQSETTAGETSSDVGTLIRINPNEPEIPEKCVGKAARHIELRTTGLKALQAIDDLLGQRK